jgi:ribosomal protein L17
VSFILDADEERILANRPEHSAEFIRNEKRLYDGVARHFGLEKIRTTSSAATTWKRMVEEIVASLQQASLKNS